MESQHSRLALHDGLGMFLPVMYRVVILGHEGSEIVASERPDSSSEVSFASEATYLEVGFAGAL